MKTFFVQPLITEKSLAMTNDGKYQFIVPTWANKNQIAQHVATHFNVTVDEVTTANFRGTAVRFKNRAGQRAAFKKATVRLTKGQTIADFSLPVEATTPTTPEQAVAPQAEAKTESKITVRSKSNKSKSTEEK